MKAVALTTVDNPYSPFTNFLDWWNYDESHGYSCCQILARLAPITDDMLPSEEHDVIEAAINRFIEADPTGIYMKLVDDEDDELVPLTEPEDLYAEASI